MATEEVYGTPPTRPGQAASAAHGQVPVGVLVSGRRVRGDSLRYNVSSCTRSASLTVGEVGSRRGRETS
ncbi:hypothetical protein [Actinomyces lilanjuaniae]|uniref:hypothetical protein n=1 Tax=Actinomyces lilanjuaniae TaxID=2321394 RepID=UPI0013C50431|nr:hypothetical protein [Actinomyces lilanjuaniae]